MEKYGVEDFKKFLAIPLELGNIADDIFADKKFEWTELFQFGKILDELGMLFTVKWSELKPAYLDLSDAERGELKTFMQEKFDITNDKIELVIESSFSILFEVESIVKKVIDLFKTK